VLIGASSVDQLEDSAAAVSNLRFSDAELAQIDRDAVDAGIDLWRTQSELA
jgi:L-glyceraldehyde 3-phosphate reductase